MLKQQEVLHLGDGRYVRVTRIGRFFEADSTQLALVSDVPGECGKLNQSFMKHEIRTVPSWVHT